VSPRFGIGFWYLLFTKEAFVLSIVNVQWRCFTPETGIVNQQDSLMDIQDRSGVIPTPDQIRNTLLAQAREQLMDISSSKSWKLISYYRQLNAVGHLTYLNCFRKLSIMLHVTLKALGLDKEDLVILRKRTILPDISERQNRLFSCEVKPGKKVAVILHLFYVDLWDEIADHLKHISCPFDLFVSIPQDKVKEAEIIRMRFPQAYIYPCVNRGRDIAPFIEVYSAIAEMGYWAMCKIHSKKSLHLSEGTKWRRDMLDALLGSVQRVDEILSLFSLYPEVGMVVPKGYLFGAVDIGTMSNLPNIQSLGEMMGLSLNNLEFLYPAGSMFWFRPENFLPLAQAGLQTDDFPPEHGQLNNTLAHALERIFGLMIRQVGQYIIETS
jgi:hypothetical protein